MKKLITNNLIFLPRFLRVFWGRTFIYMLGKFGSDEWYLDMNLMLELNKWIETNKVKNKQ